MDPNFIKHSRVQELGNSQWPQTVQINAKINGVQAAYFNQRSSSLQDNLKQLIVQRLRDERIMRSQGQINQILELQGSPLTTKYPNSANEQNQTSRFFNKRSQSTNPLKHIKISQEKIQQSSSQLANPNQRLQALNDSRQLSQEKTTLILSEVQIQQPPAIQSLPKNLQPIKPSAIFLSKSQHGSDKQLMLNRKLIKPKGHRYHKGNSENNSRNVSQQISANQKIDISQYLKSIQFNQQVTSISKPNVLSQQPSVNNIFNKHRHTISTGDRHQSSQSKIQDEYMLSMSEQNLSSFPIKSSNILRNTMALMSKYTLDAGQSYSDIDLQKSQLSKNSHSRNTSDKIKLHYFNQSQVNKGLTNQTHQFQGNNSQQNITEVEKTAIDRMRNTETLFAQSIQINHKKAKLSNQFDIKNKSSVRINGFGVFEVVNNSKID
eukprot:403369904